MARNQGTASHPLRRSTRLRGFDYHTNTAYVLTMCTHDRRPLFGAIVDGMMRLSAIGRIVDAEWRRTSEIRESVALDVHVVMPNHLHGIVLLQSQEQAPSPTVGQFVTQSQTAGALVRGFKAAVSRAVREGKLGTSPVWQHNYHDHIIRNERELDVYREYIVNNPAKWELDRYHPDKSTLPQV